MTKLKFTRKFLLLLFLLCAVVTEVGARTIYFYDAAGWGNVEIWATVNYNNGVAYTMESVPNTDHWKQANIDNKFDKIAFAHYVNGNKQGSIDNLDIPAIDYVYYIANSNNTSASSVHHFSLHGDISGWNSQNRVRLDFSKTGYYFEYQLPNTNATGNFYFYDDNTNAWRANKVNVQANDESWHEIGSLGDSADNNIAAFDGTRTIIVDPLTEKFKVEFVGANYKKLYFYNAKNVSSVSVWCWGGGNGFGTTMTKIGSTGWMECNIPDYLTNVSFKNADTNTDIAANKIIPMPDDGEPQDVQSPVIAYFVDSAEGDNGKWAGQIVGLFDWDFKTLYEWEPISGGLLKYAIPASDQVDRVIKFYKHEWDGSKYDESWLTNVGTIDINTDFSNGNWWGLERIDAGPTTIKSNVTNGSRIIFYNALTDEFMVEYEKAIPNLSDPEHPQALVKSFYSDYYTKYSDINSDAFSTNVDGWPATVSTTSVNGNYILDYQKKDGQSNFYFWVPFGKGYDLSDMEYVHFDILPNKSGYVKLYPENGDNKHYVQINGLVPNVWNRVNIKLSDLKFNGESHTCTHSWTNISTLKFDAENCGITSFYLDNVYFFKEAMSGFRESPDPQPINNSINFGPEDVISVFSEYYGNIDNNLNWGGEFKTFSEDSSNRYLLFENKQQGGVTINWSSLGLTSDFSHLRFDIFASETMKLKVVVQNSGDTDAYTTTKEITGTGSWQTVVIDGVSGDLSNVNKVNFLTYKNDNSELTTTFAIDNVYFYRDNYETYNRPGTNDDNDNNGLNWNVSSGGTKDYVTRVLVAKKENADIYGMPTLQIAEKAHDWDISTSTDTERGNTEEANNKYYVLQLDKKIYLGDIELVWGNGYPEKYEVRATDSWPIKNHKLDDDVWNSATHLFSNPNTDGQGGFKINYAPYYDIHSKLNNPGATENWGRFIIIKMTKRGNDFLSYILKEAHVGLQNNNTYFTQAGLGMDEVHIMTAAGSDKEVHIPYMTNGHGANIGNASNVTVTVNSADAHLVTVTPVGDGFKFSATAPGKYTLNLSDGSHSGTATLVVGQTWTKNQSEAAADVNKKYSIIQRDGVKVVASHIEESNQSELEANDKKPAAEKQDMMSLYRPSGYIPSMVKDGVEAEDDASRWCSGSWFTQKNWPDNNGNVNGPEWLLFDLDGEFAIKNLEIVWEQAFASTYEVYGFRSLTDAGLSTNNIMNLTDADKTTIRESITQSSKASNLIMTKSLGIAEEEFPYYDNNDIPADNIKPSNQARYLLVKLTEKTTEFGYSIWEIYSEGDDVEILNKVNKLKPVAPDLSIIMGKSKIQSVTAVKKDEETVKIENFNPVTFTVYTDAEHTQKLENQSDYLEIPYNGNHTYTVIPKQPGTYYVQIDGKNGQNYEMEAGYFVVNAYQPKSPMVLKEDTGTKQVYGDGYYDESVLLSNSSRTVTEIDLTNVDFVNKYIGQQIDQESHDAAYREENGLVSIDEYKAGILTTTELPAPYTINAGNGHEKMNPNVVYYVDVRTLNSQAKAELGNNDDYYNNLYSGKSENIHGENLAKKQNGDTWLIDVLRIWDAWNFVPTTQGGITATKVWFYTHLEAKKYSFLTLPFEPNWDKLTTKGIKLYQPVKYNAAKNSVSITELQNQSSEWNGRPYIIYTDQEQYDGKNGDYTLTISGRAQNISIQATPRDSKPSEPSSGIEFIGTYSRIAGPKSDASNKYFWYSSATNLFNEITSQEPSTIEPFYAYMKVASNVSGAKPVSGMSFVLLEDDDNTTGVNTLQQNMNDGAIYTIGGLKVANDADEFKNLPKGIYIINGKKVVK